MKPGHSPRTEDLKEALIAAVEVAREGQKEKPPIDPPARLKQITAFSKFPERALDQVREVLESDEEFRERVAGAIEEEESTRIGWLWLSRPNGWEQEVSQLAAAAEQELEQSADAQIHQALEQKLQRSETALKKAERQREKAGRERDEARSQATQARSQAHQSQQESAKLVAKLAQKKVDLDAIQKSLARAERKESRTAEKLKTAKAQIDRLKKELRDSRAQYDEEANSLKERLGAARAGGGEQRAGAPGSDPPREPEPEPPPPLTRRTPAPLPPGMLKDTVEATEHLL
nr:hypothetical protein [Acidimicrobiia bacterium]